VGEAILFDALGTLVALEPPAPRLARVLLERFALEVPLADAERAIAAEIAYYRAHLDDGRDPASLADLRSRSAEALRAALPAVAAVAPASLTEALLASLSFSAFADVAPVLEALRARGTRLIVVSNWDCSLHAVLARVGLANLLDGVVTSAEAGARKPAPEIFVRGLQIAGSSPAEAIHVGDSLEEDIAGARAAGVRAVLIRRDGSSGPEDVRTIATLAELLASECDHQ
jgi:putative hydrolase of the HAD superfamily